MEGGAVHLSDNRRRFVSVEGRRVQSMGRPQISHIDHVVLALVAKRRLPIVGRLVTIVLQIMGVHIPARVQIGRGFLAPHATAGIVLHYTTVIGNDVTIFHGVTVGRADGHDPSRAEIPGCVIEDGAVICAGATLLAGTDSHVVVGAGAVVAANSVVTHSVPAGETWGGIPAHRIS